MTPRTVSSFWLKKICEAASLLSLVVLLLFGLSQLGFAGQSLSSVGGKIGLLPAVVALFNLAVSVVCHRWLTKSPSKVIGTAIYLLILIQLATLSTGGGLGLPLATLWSMSLLFAPFFGWLSVILAIFIATLSLATPVITDGLSLKTSLPLLTVVLIPSLTGILLWARRPQDARKDSLYSSLTNSLGSIKNRSDIVINGIDDGVIALAGDGTIDLFNPAAQNLIGWNQNDAIGLGWQSVIRLVDGTGQSADGSNNPIHQAITNRESVHSDKYTLITNSDKKRLISLACTPVDTQGGGGVIVVFRDITKEKAEERDQAEFISTASHEMRTPVASIEGYLGLALNPATASIDEKAREYITKAHDSAQHLGRLFSDLLDISRADDGRLKSDPRVIDIVSFVGNIAQGLAHQAADKGLRFIYKPDPEFGSGENPIIAPIYYADIDPDHFREVTANLIENAIKYTIAGDVVIDVIGDDKLVTVSVQDSGIGIPTEDLPHLFQKFYRVDNTDTREIGGTGLGLYLSRRLTESMSGHLRVDSVYQKGSTFSLDVPRISHEDAMRRLNQIADEPTPVTAETRPRLEVQDAPAQPVSRPSNNQPIETPTPPVANYQPQPPQASQVAPAAPTIVADHTPPAPQPYSGMPSQPAATPPPPQVGQQYTAGQISPGATLSQIEQQIAHQKQQATSADHRV